MNRLQRFLLAGILAAPIVMLASCQDNTVSLEILQAQEVDRPACTVTGNVGTGLVGGILDVGLVQATGAPGYVVAPVVQNNLVDPTTVNATGTPPVMQRTDVLLNGVDVRLTLSGALAAAVPTKLRSFYIPRGIGALKTGATVGFEAEVLPAPIGILMNQVLADGQTLSMIASFRAVGSHQGETITSGWLDFPISVCRFCLTGGRPPICPGAGYTMAEIQNGACNIAQDKNVTCCTGTQNQLLCGSQVPVKTGM